MRRPFCHRCRRNRKTFAALKAGLAALPDALDAALARETNDALAHHLAKAQSLYVTGRGPAFGIALEAALKAKETAGIHAEAFSSAELMHGPAAARAARFPRRGVRAETPPSKAWSKRSTGCVQWVAWCCRSPRPKTAPAASARPPLAMPSPTRWCSLLAWYRAIEKAAKLRGHDPKARQSAQSDGDRLMTRLAFARRGPVR